MADIFGRTEQIFMGGLSADAAYMNWSGLQNGGLGLLITQMSIQYQQPVRRIYEIGPMVGGGQPVWYVVGRPEGQLQISRIAGPVGVLSGFYEKYGSPCNENPDLTFVSLAGCTEKGVIDKGGGIGAINGLDKATPLSWEMSGCLITSVGLGATAQEMLVSENVNLMFTSLDVQTF